MVQNIIHGNLRRTIKCRSAERASTSKSWTGWTAALFPVSAQEGCIIVCGRVPADAVDPLAHNLGRSHCHLDGCLTTTETRVKHVMYELIGEAVEIPLLLR